MQLRSYTYARQEHETTGWPAGQYVVAVLIPTHVRSTRRDAVCSCGRTLILRKSGGRDGMAAEYAVVIRHRRDVSVRSELPIVQVARAGGECGRLQKLGPGSAEQIKDHFFDADSSEPLCIL